MKINEPKKPRFGHPPDTREGRQERAVAVMKDPHGFVNEKVEFLRLKGMSGDEILEALNTATGGELIRTTVPSDPRQEPHQRTRLKRTEHVATKRRGRESERTLKTQA